MKKVFAFFALLMSFQMILGASSNSTRISIGDFGYLIDENTKEAIVTYCEGIGDVVVPAQIEYLNETYCVTELGTQAFLLNYDVKSVKIEHGIKIIGEAVFEECINLGEVIIPGSVIEIKNSAFIRCYNLSRLIIESSDEPLTLGYNDINTYIKEGLLKSAVRLKYISIGRDLDYEISPFDFFVPNANTNMTIILGGKMKTVNKVLFMPCTNIMRLEIGSSIEIIEPGAFGSCRQLLISDSDLPLTINSRFNDLEYLELGRNIKELNSNPCFGNNTALECVAFRRGITIINDRMFENCTGLSDIWIPGNIKIINDGAFTGCSGVRFVHFEESEDPIVVGIGGGNAYNPEGLFKDSPLERIWIYRDIVNRENGYASPFQGTPVNTAIFGENVTEVPFGCFKECKNIYAVGFLGNKIKKIGAQAFSKCAEITDRIDDDLDVFPEEFSLPNTVEEIGHEAFYESEFRMIRVPSKVTTIEWATFFNCEKLQLLYLPSDLKKIKGLAFGQCQIREINIPDKVETIEAGAFHSSKIYKVTLGREIQNLDNPFIECTNLHEIVSLAEVPPVFRANSFEEEDYSRIKITVPDNSISEYQNAKTWEDFLQYSRASSPMEIVPSKIELNVQEFSMSLNERVQLVVSVRPETTYDKTVIWSTSDASIATVDTDGNVTAVAVGEAVITATCGEKSATCKVTVNPVLAERITLNKTELTLAIGAIDKLTATVLPDDVTDNTVIWTSSDNTIVKVDAEGNIQALSLGEATITASCGEKSATCKVTVNPVFAESITLDKTELTLTIGAIDKLTATVLPDDVTDKTVTWTSSDNTIVKVDAEGNIQALSLGEATITASCGEKSATCKVTVNPVFAESITLDKTELTLTIGAIDKLTATVLPDDVTDNTVTWTSSDDTIVTVDEDGNVTAISEGEAVITASCGGLLATCQVKVEDVVTGIVYVGNDHVNIIVNGTELIVETAHQDAKVTIVRQDGALIYTGNNRDSYYLVRGLYIVIVNDTTQKIVVN